MSRNLPREWGISIHPDRIVIENDDGLAVFDHPTTVAMIRPMLDLLAQMVRADNAADAAGRKLTIGPELVPAEAA